MSKNAWTRVEYTLLLRAWQEVLEQDKKLSNNTTTTITTTTMSNNESSKDESKDNGKSTKSVAVRAYDRFNELSDGGSSKRTQNAATLQRAVLSFNFSFILQYNMAHGANAWVSLPREDREEVYNREKTTSYYFVDLDPSMIARLTAIRKLLANESAAAAASAAVVASATLASSLAFGNGSGMLPKGMRGRPPKKRSPKPRMSTGNAPEVYRAIIDAKGSDEEDEGSISESSSSDDAESDSSADLRPKKRKKLRKMTKDSAKSHSKPDHKYAGTIHATMLGALDAIKRDVRHLEKLIHRDQHGRRGDEIMAKKSKIGENIKRS